MSRSVERIAVALGALYVLVLGWAMVNISYDLWGAFVLLPAIVFVSVPVLKLVFPDTASGMFKVAFVGLCAKLVASMFRYYVAYVIYDGSTDSASYHTFAKLLGARIRRGDVSSTQIIPSGSGTVFVERLTASIYTIVGSSRLAGFFVFAWMAYWGAVLFVRAAMIAVPSLNAKRYASIVLFVPSVLYWPSSIGKEAWLLFVLGIASYGIARLLAHGWGWKPILLTVVGASGAGLVRPHLAAMWIGALVVALASGLFMRGVDGRRRGTFAKGCLLVFAVLGLLAVGQSAVKFLDPSKSVDSAAPVVSQISTIFASASRRTDEGGSTFQTQVINGPLDWPYAIGRTLTRPLLTEVNSIAGLIPAFEMTGLFIIGVASRKRLYHVFRMARTNPYVVFALVVVAVFGLAFTSIGNLGILVRQRSVVMPLFVLPWCLSPRPSKRSLSVPYQHSSDRHDGGALVGAALVGS